MFAQSLLEEIAVDVRQASFVWVDFGQMQGSDCEDGVQERFVTECESGHVDRPTVFDTLQVGAGHSSAGE